MAAPEQFIPTDNFAPFLDCGLPDVSLDFQSNNWNQFEYEWRSIMSANAYHQNIAWNSISTENLNTEYLLGPQPMMSRPAYPITGFEDFTDDMLYVPPESTHLTPLSSLNDSYSRGSPFTSGSQQNSLSPSETLSSTPPSAPPEAFYTCETCAKKFEKKNVLNRHKKQHEKPFHCHLCDKRFAENRDMRRHIVVHHSGQTPGLSQPRYLCSETGCRFAQAGFGRKDHLTRHIRRAHSRLTP